MAIKTISNFRDQLRGGGARPNLFEVNLGNFGGTAGLNVRAGWEQNAQRDFQFLCKATSMPTQTIGTVEIPFRGRILKVAGDRTFEPWTVTVINDESFSVRKAFEAWTEKINNIEDGVGEVNPNNYMGNGTIKQLSRAASLGNINAVDNSQRVKHTYQVEEIWPSEIGSIDLSYESSDAIEEFTVTFQIQYFRSIATPAQQEQENIGANDLAGTTANIS